MTAFELRSGVATSIKCVHLTSSLCVHVPVSAPCFDCKVPVPSVSNLTVNLNPVERALCSDTVPATKITYSYITKP